MEPSAPSIILNRARVKDDLPAPVEIENGWILQIL